MCVMCLCSDACVVLLQGKRRDEPLFLARSLAIFVCVRVSVCVSVLERKSRGGCRFFFFIFFIFSGFNGLDGQETVLQIEQRQNPVF